MADAVVDAVVDRRALLADASAHQLAELFRRVELIARVIARPAGTRVPIGGWVGSFRAATSPGELDGLARLLGEPEIIAATLRELTVTQYQLVQLAAWHGGTLTIEQLAAELDGGPSAELEADADLLAAVFLAHRRSAWLTLLPDVGKLLRSEGTSLRDGLEQHVNSDQIDGVLRHLGHQQRPTRKAERIERLVEHLRDPARLAASVASLSPDARRVLGELVERRRQPIHELDPQYRRRYWGGSPRPATSPLQELEDRGLVHIDAYEYRVDIWLDVLVTIRGRLYDDWPQPAPLEPVSIDPTIAAVPPVVGTCNRLLAVWGTAPAEGLAAGGIGVRAVRAAAKTLGVAPTTVAGLAALGVHLGVLGLVTLVPATRRGRSWTAEKTGWAPTTLRAQWEALHPAVQWAQLVQAWRDTPLMDETDGLADRFTVGDEPGGGAKVRARVLRCLAGLPEGQGIEPDALASHLTVRHPFEVDAASVSGVVAVMRLLGLVPDTGVVGLTPLARRLLSDPETVHEAVAVGTDRFIVQADHTIVAPPDLAPELLPRLDDVAVCESSAGARLYRLDEARIARALDAGTSADAILGFLGDHATAPVPQAVEYLVRDVARRHGSLRVGTVAAYLTADDPALLGRAVAVRTAKLRALAPTVAVSSLAADKLVQVLRAKGLVPVVEGADTGQVQLETPVGEAAATAKGLPRLRPLTADDEWLTTRARKLTRK